MARNLGDIVSAGSKGSIDGGDSTPAFGQKCCRTIKVEVTGTYYRKPPGTGYNYLFDTTITKKCNCTFNSCPPNVPYEFKDAGNQDQNPDGTTTPLPAGHRNFTYTNEWSDEQGPCGNWDSPCKCEPSWVVKNMRGIGSVASGYSDEGDWASHADNVHKSIQDDIEDLMERYDPGNHLLNDWECCRD